MFKKFMIQLPLMDSVDVGGGGGGGAEADPIRDAITSSIESEGGIDPGDGSTPPPAKVTTPTQTPEELAEEQELTALEKDWMAKNPTVKGNMPLHRHQAVLTRHRNQWTKAETDYKQKVEKYEKDLAEWKKYEWSKDPDLQGALQALHLAETDQKAFVDYLLKDERFASLIDYKQVTPAVTDKAPGPDQKDADGNPYWSQEGLDKRFEWERQQAAKVAAQQLEKQQKDFEARYKPVVEEHEARNQWNRTMSEQKGVLDNARAKWAGFKEHESAIRKAMEANDDWDLKDAYIMTVPSAQQGQFKADREKIRQELIAEMNGKKGAVSVVKPGQVPERDGGGESEDPIGDAIRASIARSAR